MALGPPHVGYPELVPDDPFQGGDRDRAIAMNPNGFVPREAEQWVVCPEGWVVCPILMSVIHCLVNEWGQGSGRSASIDTKVGSIEARDHAAFSGVFSSVARHVPAEGGRERRHHI